MAEISFALSSHLTLKSKWHRHHTLSSYLKGLFVCSDHIMRRAHLAIYFALCLYVSVCSQSFVCTLDNRPGKILLILECPSKLQHSSVSQEKICVGCQKHFIFSPPVHVSFFSLLL